MLREFFVRLKSGTEHLNYGRPIIRSWGAEYLRGLSEESRTSPLRVFDLGCGHGEDLLNVREGTLASVSMPTEVRLYGVESHEPYVEECREHAIETYAINIERAAYPNGDGFYDLVIANQILEHTKEIFWIFAETARVLKPGGRFIVGVPNLASLHNRILLLFGQQPTCQQNLSAHVRGFTKPDFRKFAEAGGFFRLLKVRGSNFYPFGATISRPLSRLFPTLLGNIFPAGANGETGQLSGELGGRREFPGDALLRRPAEPGPLRFQEAQFTQRVASGMARMRAGGIVFLHPAQIPKSGFSKSPRVFSSLASVPFASCRFASATLCCWMASIRVSRPSETDGETGAACSRRLAISFFNCEISDSIFSRISVFSSGVIVSPLTIFDLPHKTGKFTDRAAVFSCLSWVRKVIQWVLPHTQFGCTNGQLADRLANH